MKLIPAFIVTSILSLGLVLTAACNRVETAAPKTETQKVIATRPEIPTAARVERVLKGLRPKMEVEGAPVRWTLVERMAAYKVPAVSIAIIDGGRVVWAQGFGVTEVGGHDPVTATTLFQAASCSKPIAASAMLRLVAMGTLSLDTDVNRYLTSWKLPENEFTRQMPVTLRRIATHTAGTTVGGFPGYKVAVPRPTVPELLDGKAPANNEPVRVDTLPGQGFRYSGGGFTIMQQILIDVTGTPFPTLLQQQVLGPFGMAHSTFEQPLPEARAADAARGHEKDVAVPGGWYVYPELAAAGLWTTPTDMATWAIAMADALAGRSTTFLSQATASQIISSSVPGRSPKERIGLGLFLYGTGDSLNFSHNGQNEGFLNEFKMFVNTGQGAAIMVNVGESGYGLIREIQFAIAAEFGWPESGTTKITAVAVDPAALDRLTGTYVIDIKSGRKLPRVVREGTRLFFEGWGPARAELYPQSPTTFIGAGGTRFSFTRDDAGRDVMTIGEGPRALTGLKQKVVNIAPVANAGPDVTINSDRYHLNASQTRYPAGLSDCDLLWTQVSGPAGATISHPAAAITPVIDLNMGVYTFRLTVTNRAGATSSDDVVITVPAQQVKDRVDDYITKEMEKAGVKGLSLAIIDGGKIVKVRGYGFTDADKATPVTPLTLFQAASTSKVLTAYGALRLVENNLLSLDEDVNRKLTSWKVPENQFTKDEKVTLRRLIAHMAGINISGFYGYPRGEPVPSLLNVLDGKPPANSAPIRVGYVPGTKTSYSGGGYAIIQQLVIDVSGQPFEEYMRDSVFSKLGMVSSTFEQLPPGKWDLAAHGYGYAMPDGKSFPHGEMPWKWNNYPEMAAAGLWTTAGDLALFVMDIQNTYAGRSSKVVTKDMVDKMLTLVPGSQWKTMGLGLVLDKPGEPNAEFRFSGTNAGFQCGSFGTVRTGQGCVIMYNDRQGEMFPYQIMQFIAKEYAWPK